MSGSISITSIVLSNFRNHRSKSFEFSPKITLIIGPNGSGKTNILEAVHLLATGESWRAEDVGEMVGFEGEVGHIEGEIEVGDRDREKMKVTLTRGAVQGKRVAKTTYKVNGVARHKAGFAGRLKVVLFEPESLQIIIGDPSNRRKFLDEILKQTDKDYANSLSVYSKALRVRNKLLDAIRDGRSRRDGLEYWERAMVKHGESLQNKRRELIEWINFNTDSLRIDYQINAISVDRLDKYREREIEAGFTFVGPQRDELEISCWKQVVSYSSRQEDKGYGKTMPYQSQCPNQQPTTNNQQLLSAFGSRGEQRMAVLRLKLLEARWIEEKTEVAPVILLDDIFSELDEEHEKMVGELIKGRQTIITATEIHKGHYPEAEIISLEH